MSADDEAPEDAGLDEEQPGSGSGPPSPPPYATDRESLERDCTVEFLKGSGPGGQHRNTRETAVRLHHRPSGVTTMASERRSQAQNREVALERMRERLEALNRRPEPRKKTRKPRRADRQRLEDKRKRSEVKRRRRSPDGDEG